MDISPLKLAYNKRNYHARKINSSCLLFARSCSIEKNAFVFIKISYKMILSISGQILTINKKFINLVRLFNHALDRQTWLKYIRFLHLVLHQTKVIIDPMGIIKLNLSTANFITRKDKSTLVKSFLIEACYRIKQMLSENV